MPDIALFLAASALLTVAPGPDIVYVLTRGIAQGPRAGFAAALGFATGCIFHTLLAALGIAALIRSSDLAFNAVRYAGAAYLAWIGIQALRHRAAFSVEGAGDARSLALIYRQSVVGNMLNPKVTLFFLALFTQVIHPATPLVVRVAYGAEMSFMTFAWFGFVAAALSHPIVKRRFVRVQKRVERIFGVLLIALGLKVALSR